MILELGAAAHQLIRVTAEYSNAVLVAVLPYFSDYAFKLQLPLPHPISVTNVARFWVVPFLDGEQQPAGTSVLLNGGWTLSMVDGYIVGFRSPQSYFTLQDPDETPRFFGRVRMSKEEAIEMARKTILKLGIPLESVFAEQEPRVTGPPTVDGTNIVPRYRVEWTSPQIGIDSAGPSPQDAVHNDVDIEVNADARRVEWLRFSLRVSRQSLHRNLIKVGVTPPKSPSDRQWPQVNPEYARRLLPVVLRAIDHYSQTLNLPMPRPLTTNQVLRFHLENNEGWPHSELELTNGWRFIYRNSMVNGFYSPDNLFSSSKRCIRVKEFLGKRNMTESEAIQLVRDSIKRFSYPTNLVHIDFQPRVQTSCAPGIPRYSITWAYAPNDDLQSKVEAEVDADRRELKSLYYDDQAYWNHPPKIDVPISLSAKSGHPE